jgi:hypothetical protein
LYECFQSFLIIVYYFLLFELSDFYLLAFYLIVVKR